MKSESERSPKQHDHRCYGRREGGREGGRADSTTYLLGRRTEVAAFDAGHDLVGGSAHAVADLKGRTVRE